MRTALVVGIDHCDNINQLGGCAHDAELVGKLLEADAVKCSAWGLRTVRTAQAENVTEALRRKGAEAPR